MRRLYRFRNVPLVIFALLAASCQTTSAPTPAKEPAATPQQPPAFEAPQPAKPEPVQEVQPVAEVQAPPPSTPAPAPKSVETPAEETKSPPPAPPQEKTAEQPETTQPVSTAGSAPSLPAKPEVSEPTPQPAPPAKTVSFLHPGEVLEFRMSWKIFSHVGDTKIETIDETVDGKRRLRIQITSKSRGLLDAFYPVVNDSDTVLDPTTGQPLSISVEGKSGSRDEKTLTEFDYKNHKIIHTDFIRPQKNATAELPDKPAYDLMVAALMSREWKLKPGEKRQVLTVFDEDLYPIELTALEREKVSTDLGKFDAVKIEAIQKGEQRGYFKKGGEFRYWVSEGDKPQILRMQFKTNAGTVTAVLHSVTPGKNQ